MDLKGPTALKGTIESHAGVRAAGVIVVVIGLLGGTALITTGAIGFDSQTCSVDVLGNDDCYNEKQPSLPLVLGGAALLVAGTIAGLALMAQHDKAIIDVVPLGTSLVRPRTLAMEGTAPSGSSDGLALRLRF